MGTAQITEYPQDVWLFGYGSLIWKPPPHYDVRLPGYITGYVRRFWQASEDHRGTPESPGRVVTLIEKSFWKTLDDAHNAAEDDRVWGAAYHIMPEKVQEVKAYLDIREINGYSIRYTPFHPADNQLDDIPCMVYIGMPDNPQFLGALEPGDVATKINESVGPSGENREYLLQLELSLESLDPRARDEHVSELARRVRSMALPQREVKKIITEPGLHQSSSTEEQEEIEKGA